MKVLIPTLSLCLGLCVSTRSHADNKVVYGEDNRLDVYEYPRQDFVDYAKATAGMIAKTQVLQTNSDSQDANAEKVFKLSGKTLAKRGICSTERFADQLSAVNCSGFLVGPDLLVTAGHCITGATDCASNLWVFDFKMKGPSEFENKFKESQIYSCKKVVSRALSSSDQNDYALIQLDRQVTGRTPLKVRTEGKIQVGDPVVVIGHPTGIPTKISDGANVRSSTPKSYFVANLDTFGGNSGSAVLNERTGEVEGILVRGETDYVYDSAKGCQVVNKCDNDECRGEDVTRITNVPIPSAASF